MLVPSCQRPTHFFQSFFHFFFACIFFCLERVPVLEEDGVQSRIHLGLQEGGREGGRGGRGREGGRGEEEASKQARVISRFLTGSRTAATGQVLCCDEREGTREGGREGG